MGHARAVRHRSIPLRPKLRRDVLSYVARYLLDTTALIDLSKGITAVQARIKELVASGAELGVCAVNVAEFVAGVPPAERTQWIQWLQEFRYWDISHQAAVHAGLYRSVFARQGRTIDTADALIAAVAWSLGATILTDNLEDFPMDDVELQSPRREPGS